MAKYYNVLFFVLMFLASCQQPTSVGAEKPQKSAEVKKATIVDVERGIRNYIKNATQAGNGRFSLHTDSFKMDLNLVRVHTEYLSVLGPGQYFACVDLADSTGDVYDVDFFLEGTATSMAVTQTIVHKLNGQPFYTWAQQADDTWQRVPIKGAPPKLLGVIAPVDSFIFNYTAYIPPVAHSAQIWLPIPTSGPFQEITLLQDSGLANYSLLEEAKYKNTVAFAKLPPSDKKREFTFTYKVIRQEKGAYKAPKPAANSYQAPEPLLPIGGKFAKLVAQALKGKAYETDLIKARALYDYVISEVRYAKQGTYGTGDANFACDSKSGNCTEFHSLFISLARTAGIPARFAIGAAIPASRNNGGVNGYHCWAEFYANGKWWPVDISEADKYTALATYYFGHHPANRVEFSRGRNLEPTPKPKSGPIPFLAYPLLEVNGQAQKVPTQFTFTRL